MTSGPANAWVCTVCGYVHRGSAPPDECPVCGAPADAFEPFEEPAPAASKTAATRWHCLNCSYIHEGDAPPDACPVCGAEADRFEPAADGDAAEGGDFQGHVLVLGGGIAGVSAAEAARQAAPQARITLISSEEEVPYYRLNLTRYLAGEVERGALPIHPASWYEDNGIELILGAEARVLDLGSQEVTTTVGHGIGFERLVLATGAHAFVPPIKGAELPGATAIRTVTDADAVLEAVEPGLPCVCIGGGVLGLETAVALSRRGAEVTVLENYGWLLPRQLNEEAGRRLQGFVEDLGVRVVNGASVERIQGNGRVESVELEGGESLPARLVTITTGVRSNSHLARKAGLHVNNGVVVDDLLRTSHPDVFAAGDVAEHAGTLYGLWTPAQYQGTIAGINAVGGDAEFGGIPRANTLKVLGLELFSIGLFAPEDGSYQAFSEGTDGAYRHFVFRDNRLVGAILLGDAALSPVVKRLIEERRDVSTVLRNHPSGREVAACLAEL